MSRIKAFSDAAKRAFKRPSTAMLLATSVLAGCNSHMSGSSPADIGASNIVPTQMTVIPKTTKQPMRPSEISTKTITDDGKSQTVFCIPSTGRPLNEVDRGFSQDTDLLKDLELRFGASSKIGGAVLRSNIRNNVDVCATINKLEDVGGYYHNRHNYIVFDTRGQRDVHKFVADNSLLDEAGDHVVVETFFTDAEERIHAHQFAQNGHILRRDYGKNDSYINRMAIEAHAKIVTSLAIWEAYGEKAFEDSLRFKSDAEKMDQIIQNAVPKCVKGGVDMSCLQDAFSQAVMSDGLYSAEFASIYKSSSHSGAEYSTKEFKTTFGAIPGYERNFLEGMSSADLNKLRQTAQMKMGG